MRFFIFFVSLLEAREIKNEFDDGFTKIIRFNKTDIRGKMLLAKFKLSRLALKFYSNSNLIWNILNEFKLKFQGTIDRKLSYLWLMGQNGSLWK